MHPEIIASQRALQRLFRVAREERTKGDIDVEVTSALESYLCIRTYAYFETSVRLILLRFVRQASNDASLERFVDSQLRRQPNLGYDVLIKLLGRFSSEWTTALKSKVTKQMKDSLDSLVNIRNNIAHGDDVDISLEDLRSYFTSAQDIVKLVFAVCAPGSGALTDA